MNNKTSCPLRFAQALMTLTLALLTAPPALAQHQLWIRQFGTSSRDWATALASDGAGGVMVAGWTEGSLGGPIAGHTNAFVTRYNQNGDQLWIRQFGKGGSSGAWALSPDGAGGVIVAGWTDGSLGGPNAGRSDAFLARYDETGSPLWIRQFGTSVSEMALALAPDGAGGVMVAGNTGGSLGGPNAGRIDAFLARYDGAGTLLWVRQFGTSGNDYAYALAPDGRGGVMIAGETDGSLGGPNAGADDAFLARYDSEGNQLWLSQFGTSGIDAALALVPDSTGGVMVGGVLLGTGHGSGYDAFLARYDESGQRLWMRQFGTTNSEGVRALALNGAGGVMVAGYSNGSLGGPNAGTRGYDAFLANYDETGNRLWIRQFGTAMRDDIARALALDGTGGVMVAGYTSGSLGGPNAGGIDAFVARYEIDSCYPDCDRSNGAGVLDMLDFLCWQEDFMAGNSYACDCDTSTGQLVCDIFDFLCFQNAFVGGCP